MSHTLLLGDCIEQMRTLPEQSVNCCVTSPPYFGLRDYGHEGQIGLEETPDAYVQRLVEVFREVRRVLRDDGTLWLNLGDSYANNGTGGNGATGGRDKSTLQSAMPPIGTTPVKKAVPAGLKPKDLIGIPWRVAFALQADGWYLRQDIIWHKPNPMPESVRDRCTKAHEYLFLLSKSPRYYYDHEAIKEQSTGMPPGNTRHKHTDAIEAGDEHHRTKAGLVNYAAKARSASHNFKRSGSKREQAIPGQSKGTHREDRQDSAYDLFSRNKRSVWTVPTKPYKEAHFAVYPPALITPCILAGCPPGGTVIDPFAGSGTTAMVAIQNGRQAISCELNPDYATLIRKRIAQTQPGLAL